MAKHRAHSIEFKRQVSQEFLAGETLHGLAKRHDICRNLIRVWVQKYEAGAFDEDAKAADLLQEYEARIAALERLVGKPALELEFLILLCHKRWLKAGRVETAWQHGHRERDFVRAIVNCLRIVAIELATWRSGRIGGA